MLMAELYKKPIHVCHVARKEEVSLPEREGERGKGGREGGKRRERLGEGAREGRESRECFIWYLTI